ncbi:MAG: DUF5309 family protein [Phycisphaerae bacterium]|nr:DUF5309 family protein [Phycisphaerae bacterium]
MAFTGKATYSGGATLPELAEDVADLIGIISPFETPLLNHLGDSLRAAHSTVHEWLEDSLLPNTDAMAATPQDPDGDTTLTVDNAERFRTGDQVAPVGSGERMIVTAVNTEAGTITVTRGYGDTAPEALADNQVLRILGNAALEGGEADDPRFTVRTRILNYTQIFTQTVSASGSELAVKQIAVADELDYQKQERLREMLRDLENTVINGVAPAANATGGDSVRRTMRGLLGFITTNAFAKGVGGFPNTDLTEVVLNTALKQIWERSAGRIDTILVGGAQKRKINAFLAEARRFTTDATTYRDLVSAYESDFGLCRIVLSRFVPADKVVLLDSSRLAVLPLAGRSFHYRPLAVSGDYERGQIVGEYTLECRNEAAHGVISGLGA